MLPRVGEPIMLGWERERKPRDESRWTPGGEGWHAWNGKAPEVEFCEFAGMLCRMLMPSQVIETGIGQGYTTRRLLAANPGYYIGFESDDEYRAAIAAIWEDDMRVSADLSPLRSPTADDMMLCELAVLDSSTPFRIQEIDLWREHAPSGSVLLVHDVSREHDEGTIHRRLAAHVAELPGATLRNPRGGWLAVQP